MAWTPSAPQRRTVAVAAALSSSHRLMQRSALMLGRGDAAKGVCIGFAAYLSILGFAVPQLSVESLTAILFVTGAMLVGVAALSPPSVTPNCLVADVDSANTPSARGAAQACLDELLATATPQTMADRAAFARLTAHMSHELRTPLNAILGFSELMSNEVFGPLGSSCYAAYARDIHASGISLLKSAEDALAITTLLTASDAGQCAQVAHAATICSEALQFHAHDFKSRNMVVSCTVDIDADIAAEPHAARQLLINLVAEAASRAEAGSELAIASRTDAGAIELLVTVSRCSRRSHKTDSFAVLLARTLGELVGARLTIDGDGVSGDGWQATVRLSRAMQSDFFAMRDLA